MSTEYEDSTESYAEFCDRQLERLKKQLALDTPGQVLARARRRAAELCDMGLEVRTGSVRPGHMGPKRAALDGGDDNR